MNNNRTVEVILKTRIKNLGGPGELVHVKNGHAVNYLVPSKRAVFATAKNKTHIEQERAHLVALDEQHTKDALEQQAKLQDIILVFARKLKDHSNIFDTIRAHNIEQELAKHGFKIEKSNINMARPITALGVYTVHIDLYGKIGQDIKVQVRPI